MRVLMRYELDMSKPINLKRLSPFEKIKAGIVSQIMQSNFYLNYKRQKEEEKYMKILQEDEHVKSLILAEFYAEIRNNRTLEEKGLKCKEVIVAIDAKYENSLRRLLPNLWDDKEKAHKDFLAFDIERVPECEDIRRAFRDMPILLRASAKTI